MITKVALLVMALLAPFAYGVTQYDTGAGIVFKLDVVQDVTLERSSTNFNYLEYLIVSKHPDYPNKRSLVQFENLPSDVSSSKIKSAQMYLYYVYAHKASFRSITSVPFIPRYMQVHLVKKSWNETQTTSGRRDSSHLWSTAYLGLDGTDAEEVPEPGTVTIFPHRPKGFVEFNVTNAVKRWREGLPNHGLVIRATNELDEGRDIRFASNAMYDSTQHAYILVSVLPSLTNESSSSPRQSSQAQDEHQSSQVQVKNQSSQVQVKNHSSQEQTKQQPCRVQVEHQSSQAGLPCVADELNPSQIPIKSSSGHIPLYRRFLFFPFIIICEFVFIV